MVLAGLAASSKPASPRGDEKAGAADDSSSSGGNSSRPARPEECFITGRSMRHSVHLVSEAQAQLFCCPCVTGAGPGGRGQPQQPPLRGLSPPGGGGGNSSSSKPFELGPKEPALDIVCLPTKEIPTGKEEGGQQPPATEEGAGATAEAAPLSWLDEEDAAVDGAAEWLLQQCLFFSSGAGGPGAASDKKASSSAVSSSSLGGGAGASEVSGSHTVMVFSSAALLDVPRLRAAVELLVERQVWFIPSDTLAPHLGPLPPSAAAAAAARNGGSLPTGFPVTALTLPAFLARWVLAALRYHWLTTTAGFPTPCPCRTRALGASSAARALAPGAAARKAPLCTAGLLLAGREDEQQQQRGDTLAYLRVAALGSSAASSCCSASCCSSSPSSASYYGFGAEAMMEMWHGMAREERLALLRRLEKAIGEEIKAHLSKAGGSGSGGPKGGKSNGGGSSSSSTSSSSNAALPSEAALPTPRRVLLHALGLVLRPDGADGGSELGAAAESEEEQLATLAEDEAVGEVLLEGLCLFRLPQVYVVASPRPALTPHLALALKHALESFYADELARRLILEEEEEEQELQKGAGGGRKGRGGGEGCSKSSAKKLRRKEKLRTWLLKRQQEEQVQQAESKAQPAAASASASSAVASSPEQPIPRRPAAVVEEDAATPVHEEREAEGKDGTEGAEPSALHSRSLSADDSINPEAPKAVAAAAVAAAAATGKGDAAGEESEKGLVGISRSTSEGSAPGTGACSPTSEVEDEEEEEDGHRSSYTTSPSGSSSSGSSSANSSTGSASAASSNSPSPTAGGPFVEPTHQGEAAEPATSACSTGRATGRAMGALLPPPPLVIDADTGAGSGAGQEQGLVPEAEAGGYYYGYEHGYPEGYAEYGREAEAEAEAEAEWSASVGRRLQLCARLSWELDDMAMGLREVAARRRPWQYCALTHLEQVVGLLWPKAHCEVYGSFTTGLSIPASDLDVVITHLPLHSRGGGGSGAGSSCSAPGAHLLSELNDFLGAQDWVASVHCVRHAAMPIIKLTTAPMPLHMTDRPGGEAEAAGEGPDGVPRGVIKIDISLDVPGMSERASGSGGGGGEAGEEDEEAEAAEEKGQAQGHQHHHQHQQQEAPVHYGLQSSMFVQRLCVVHPQLPPLVLVLKQLLLQRGLSDSYTGGLSSYALSIMVAAILQPYVLEPPEMQPNLGALFLTFLQTYGTATFDTGRFGVCLAPPPYGPLFALTGEHGGGGLDEQSRSWKPTDPVVIQDPLCAANNVGRSCFGFRQVQVVFDQCLSRLLLYGERILAEEEARAARLMGGASQWQQQKKAAANAGALIGSTEGGHDEGKEGEGGESEGAEPVTAESVLGIALFGASHHRCVLAYLCLCKIDL